MIRKKLIRYDWIVLSELPVVITLQVLYALMDLKSLKDNPRYIIEPISRFKDTSAFLINPLALIMNKGRHTDDDIYLYLELAALRQYANYKENGDLSLTTHYTKHLYDLDKLRANTMLSVTNEGKITFKYEEE
jgi:hypothetical protein